jgi:hypothetical protein
VRTYEGASALIFMVSLPCYDQAGPAAHPEALTHCQVLPQVQSQRALPDCLSYFRTVCALKQFADTPIILCLNKTDIFREKLETVRLPVVMRANAAPDAHLSLPR